MKFYLLAIAVRETTHHGDTWGLTQVKRDVKKNLQDLYLYQVVFEEGPGK